MKKLISFLLFYGLTTVIYAPPAGGAPTGPLMDLYMESKDNLAKAEKQAVKAANAAERWYLDFDTGENHTEEYKSAAAELRTAEFHLNKLKKSAIQQKEQFGIDSFQYMEITSRQKITESQAAEARNKKDKIAQKLARKSELFKKGKNSPQFQQVRQNIIDTQKQMEELNNAAYQAAAQHGLKSKQYKEMRDKHLKAGDKLLNLHKQYDTLAANIMGPDWKRRKKAALDKYAAAQKNMLDLTHKRNVYKAAHQCANMYLAGGKKQAQVLSILNLPEQKHIKLGPNQNRPWRRNLPPWPGKPPGPLGFGFGQSLIQGFHPNFPPPRLPGEPGYHGFSKQADEGSGSVQ